ncbi:hypothetical protein [Halosegnis rubeus]|uniref:Uncharacterized protein n=1 Tax=Halosegnis rubeus TaxID=2212850 RepID=A0A5N5UF38_9EURY|nr:hypothetical protein [Halosegnis rubeus]KAB7517090.1 hypothetical protein DMP03_06950 [Halosegnis rubeus]
MTDHSNDERTVRCPVDGCDATPLARGINLHVRQTTGNGHGPQGEIPDSVNFENLDTVGEREVTMDYPEERETEDSARLCPYCSLPFRGANGVLIHLGQVAGRKNHPENAAADHTEADFPQVELDEQGNITVVPNRADVTEETTKSSADIPRQRVYQFIATLLADDEPRMAHRVRRGLLGVDNAISAKRGEPPHPALFESLLAQGRAEVTEHRLTTALEGERLMVSCRGESALYTANEAREVADRLEQVAAVEGWTPEIARGLIEVYRYGAEVLEGDRTERSFHKELRKRA